jgi:hypothetical protein
MRTKRLSIAEASELARRVYPYSAKDRNNQRLYHDSRQLRLKRGAWALGAGSIVLFLAAPLSWAQPSAFRLDYHANTGHVQGTLNAFNDDTRWDLQLQDKKADNEAVYLEVIIDVDKRPDKVFRGGNTSGGKTARFRGATHQSRTLGAVVNICQAKPKAPDPCERVNNFRF